MQHDSPRILTLNGGASSLKFALFRAHPALERELEGKIDRIGGPRPALSLRSAGREPETSAVEARDQPAAAERLLAHLAADPGRFSVAAVGHRIVHGGPRHLEPCIVTEAVRAQLEELAPLDPEHLPFELALIDGVRRRWPALAQIACFDTAFHRDLPRVAQLLPL